MFIKQLGNSSLPSEKPDIQDTSNEENIRFLKDLHTLLIEVCIERFDILFQTVF